MRSLTRFWFHGLLVSMLAASALPASADAQGAATPAPAGEATCRVPQPGDPAPARPRADLAAVWAGAAAQAAQADREGVRPLNTRGYNYDTGHGGIDPAALDFEVRGR